VRGSIVSTLKETTLADLLSPAHPAITAAVPALKGRASQPAPLTS
jgi:hypothetical protein